MKVVNSLRSHFGGVTVIGKVCVSSRRCWVKKEVLISPGGIHEGHQRCVGAI